MQAIFYAPTRPMGSRNLIKSLFSSSLILLPPLLVSVRADTTPLNLNAAWRAKRNDDDNIDIYSVLPFA